MRRLAESINFQKMEYNKIAHVIYTCRRTYIDAVQNCHSTMANENSTGERFRRARN